MVLFFFSSLLYWRKTSHKNTKSQQLLWITAVTWQQKRTGCEFTQLYLWYKSPSWVNTALAVVSVLTSEVTTSQWFFLVFGFKDILCEVDFVTCCNCGSGMSYCRSEGVDRGDSERGRTVWVSIPSNIKVQVVQSDGHQLTDSNWKAEAKIVTFKIKALHLYFVHLHIIQQQSCVGRLEIVRGSDVAHRPQSAMVFVKSTLWYRFYTLTFCNCSIMGCTGLNRVIYY